MRFALGKKQTFRDKDVIEREICSAVCCGKVNNWQRQKRQKYDSKAFENNKENYIKQTKYTRTYVHTKNFSRSAMQWTLLFPRGRP